MECFQTSAFKFKLRSYNLVGLLVMLVYRGGEGVSVGRQGCVSKFDQSTIIDDHGFYQVSKLSIKINLYPKELLIRTLVGRQR